MSETVLKMEESDFNERAQKHLPVRVIERKWEGDSYIVYFVYVKKEER